MRAGLRSAVFAGLILVAILSAVSPVPLRAQGTVQASVVANVNLRTGPGAGFAIVTSLISGTQITIQARNTAADWLLATTPKGKRGWLMARQVQLPAGFLAANLPVSQEVIGAAEAPAPIIPGEATAAPDSGFDAKPDANTASLPSYAAKLTPAVRSAMRAVYLRGRALGNNPRVFSKVGDCLIGHVWFFSQFGDGQANDLGPYGGLQDVINHFSVAPRAGVLNSFTAESLAAHAAFTSAAVLDPQWANPALCKTDESPLRCEFRNNRPSVAIIMFGVVDVTTMSVGQFDGFLRSIVKQTIAQGTIPILTIAPENRAYPAKAKQFNSVVISVAATYKVPLINLRGALASLPDKGIDSDGIHLTPFARFGRVAFEGADLQYGLTRWNLLALQSLDAVWRQIMY